MVPLLPVLPQAKNINLPVPSLTSAEELAIPTCSTTDESCSPEPTSLPWAEEMNTHS